MWNCGSVCRSTETMIIFIKRLKMIETFYKNYHSFNATANATTIPLLTIIMDVANNLYTIEKLIGEF